jgi:hypothetical protein
MKIVTLANLAESTKQEVFGHVLAHARKQQCKSMSETLNSCVYRDGKGNSCFAGALMTDEEHQAITADKQRGNRNYMGWLSMAEMKLVPSAHQFLISQLQSIHDHYRVEEWETRFTAIAYNFNLNCAPPTKEEA